jgi:hypothetical protein
VELLTRATALLNGTKIDQTLNERGWTRELADFVANGLSECQVKIAGGWLPPPRYGDQWTRLLMDNIDFGDDGGLAHAVYEAVFAVTQLGAEGKQGSGAP